MTKLTFNVTIHKNNYKQEKGSKFKAQNAVKKSESPLQQLQLQLTIHQKREQHLAEASLKELPACIWSQISRCHSKI